MTPSYASPAETSAQTTALVAVEAMAARLSKPIHAAKDYYDGLARSCRSTRSACCRGATPCGWMPNAGPPNRWPTVSGVINPKPWGRADGAPTARVYIARSALKVPSGFTCPNWAMNALGGIPEPIDPMVRTAARGLSLSALRLLEDPKARDTAMAEFKARTGGGIHCMAQALRRQG